MAVSFAARVRTRINTWVGRHLVPVVGAGCCLAGAASPIAPSLAFAVGVGLVAAWATAVLVRTALRIHHVDGTFAACRGAGFIGMGALVAGLTSVVPAIVAPGEVVPLGVVGLGAAATLYVIGTLLLPGAATTVAVRLRRSFDGLGLGVSLSFAAWLLPPVADRTSVAVLAAALCASAGISIVTVTVLRAVAHRRAALHCGAGAIAVVLGLCAAVIELSYGGAGRWLAGVGVLLVTGLALTVRGGARVEVAPTRSETRDADQHLSGYPLLAIPAAVGVLSAAYHLITVGQFNRTAITLGLAMVSLLTLRELLAVADIRRYARRLTLQEAHFRSLVTGATDLTLVLDERLTVRWQSPAAARLFGLADAEVVGRSFLDMIHPDDVDAVRAVLDIPAAAGEQVPGPPTLVNARLYDGHGMWRDTESTVSDQRATPEVAALVVHVRDVGERRHLERTLHQLSYTDQLTGLQNRRALMREVTAASRCSAQRGTLLVIDLHGLAEINDSRGREVGDAVLIEVGRRIRGLLGADDVPARLGGDEFAVLFADGAVLAYALATRLVTLLAEPYRLPGAIVDLHTSVGLAEVSGAKDADEVLRHADLARSRARQLGRDRVEWYDSDVEALVQRRMELEHELIGAVPRGELDLVFQPVLSLRDNRPVGVEALLRWRHPTLGTILPDELLPIAEAVGVTREVGDWVVDAACRRLALWSGGVSSGDSGLWMSINVTPRELLATGFPGRVAATLARHGLAPERLVVEVAETWIAEDVPAVVSALAALRKSGVRAALDDFGGGQASLSHLRRLPVDLLKLDSSLLRAGDDRLHAGEDRGSGGAALINVVVSLGRRLGLELVAKGIETAEQAALAGRAGCGYGQGFGLARPAPAERIEAYLDAHRTASS